MSKTDGVKKEHQPKLVMIPLAQIVEDPSQPRKVFNEAELMELAESIKLHGLIQAITVKKLPLTPLEKEAGEPPKYMIVSGERRVRAHIILGRTHIEAKVQHVPEENLAAFQLAENLHRVALNALEMARSFADMLKSKKYTVDDVAARVNKKRKYVYQHLMLLKLIPDAQQLLNKDHLPFSHALALAALDEKKQKKALRWLVSYPYGEDKEPLIRQMNEFEEFLQNTFFLDLKTAPWNKADETLVPAAGACTLCEKRTRSQSALFSDMISETDSCMDGKCFKLKRETFLKLKTQSIEASEGKAPVPVAVNYEKNLPENVVYTYTAQIVTADERCEKCEPGIFVNGANAGKECFVCYAERKEEPEVVEVSPEYQEDVARSSAFMLLSLQQPKPDTLKLLPRLLKCVAAQLWESLSLSDAQLLVERWNWKVGELEVNAMMPVFWQQVKDFAPEQVERLVIDITVMLTYSDMEEHLPVIAGELGVKDTQKPFQQMVDRLTPALELSGWEECNTAAELYAVAERKDMLEWLNHRGYEADETLNNYSLAREVIDNLK